MRGVRSRPEWRSRRGSGGRRRPTDLRRVLSRARLLPDGRRGRRAGRRDRVISTPGATEPRDAWSTMPGPRGSGPQPEGAPESRMRATTTMPRGETAERLVVDRLRAVVDPGVLVLDRVQWLLRERGAVRNGEADVVIGDSERGILVIE